ncbi:MAG TPA: serpin family protein [Gemmatimonadaceae bacterium]|nr:serpin family protein [Gemmatimonadaceae bacterium]
MRLSGLLALVVLAAACSDPNAPSGSTPRITALPRALSSGEQAVIGASNAFGFGLLRELDRTRADSNIFMSPLSASMALGMTMNGAAGQTFDEMRASLGLGSRSSSEINASYRSLIDMLRGLDATVDFRIANSIWYRNGFPFEQTFLDESRQFFDAKVAGLDFGASNAAPTINDWVNQSTNKKIDKIVDGPIPNDVVMYLINAIYFNGSWTTRFDKAQTRSEPFNTVGGTTAPIAMMRRTDTIRVAETADAQLVDLPYGGGAYTMTILLPKQGKAIRDVVSALTADSWQAAVAGATARQVELQMPKFTLRWEALLNDPLQALGMRQAFQGDVADFTRMSRSAGNHLYISKVKQKSFVDVHEEGTEAAAVTSVEIRVTCACGPGVIRIDRPFVFAIRERLSGTILFLGKIVRPPA